MGESHKSQAEQGDSAASCRSLFTIGTESIFLRQNYKILVFKILNNLLLKSTTNSEIGK